jgi:L-lysine 2,3-aminomutase
MIMRTTLLERYIEPLLALPQLASIRIGTKAPAYWPHRFTTDADADALAALRARRRGGQTPRRHGALQPSP